MTLTGLAFGGMFLAQTGDVLLVAVLAGLGGAAGGCGAVVAPSIQADVIDFDEYRSGQRKEGAYFAAWSFVFKGASGITFMLTGLVLQFSGFVPKVEQNPTALAPPVEIQPQPGGARRDPRRARRPTETSFIGDSEQLGRTVAPHLHVYERG
jgi:hypothetical protein